MRNRLVLPIAFVPLLAGVVTAPPALELNHVWVVLDSTSYDAIAGSPFVGDTLAVARVATVSDGQATWSALYLFGSRTYLELYREGHDVPPVGTVALAFSSDRGPAADQVAQRLRENGLSPRRTSRRRVSGTDTLPWFVQVDVEAEATTTPWIRWWVMDYDPGLMASRWPTHPALAGRTDRAAYLTPLQDSTRLLADLAAIHIALPQGDREAVAQQLAAAGLERSVRNNAVVLRSEEFEIVLADTSGGRSGMLSLGGTLHRPAGNGVRTAGPTSIGVHNRRAFTLGIGARCGFQQVVVRTRTGPMAACIGGPVGAPLVVFESGLGEGMEAWAGVMDSLSSAFRVLSYDRAGIGDTPAASAGFSATETSDRLIALLDALGEQRPAVFVGHSIGGAYAQVMAARHPARVEGLVLVDPTPAGFFATQRATIGEAQWAAQQARAKAALGGATLSEWEEMEASLRVAETLRGNWAGRVQVLSAGLVQNPDTTVGRIMKREWLSLHAGIAARLGGTQDVLAGVGHRIQDARPDVVAAAIRGVSGTLPTVARP